jgi:hypothetical protein
MGDYWLGHRYTQGGKFKCRYADRDTGTRRNPRLETAWPIITTEPVQHAVQLRQAAGVEAAGVEALERHTIPSDPLQSKYP